MESTSQLPLVAFDLSKLFRTSSANNASTHWSLITRSRRFFWLQQPLEPDQEEPAGSFNSNSTGTPFVTLFVRIAYYPSSPQRFPLMIVLNHKGHSKIRNLTLNKKSAPPPPPEGLASIGDWMRKELPGKMCGSTLYRKNADERAECVRQHIIEQDGTCGGTPSRQS
ncbi:hypothetical protein DSL72_006880 [Monilinia vaccinii-corymbosi]|uniref:Uncharacterized protein n=1 Tax=Monilinia vaccinii-corymbosi TaxID=61207 RepID=A0A8A3PKA1_9HELO|nr:hypothetical protein DSL72_006880 [Monilinia vaccinii-corymbosi]